MADIFKFNFVEILNSMVGWGHAIHKTFMLFFQLATEPMIPPGTFRDTLEVITGPSNWLFNLLIDFYTDGAITSIWQMSLFDLVVPCAFCFLIYTVVKWVLDIVL